MRRHPALTALLVGAVLSVVPLAAAAGLLALTAPSLALAVRAHGQPADLLVAGCGSLGVLLLLALAADVLRAGVQEASSLRRRATRPARPARAGAVPSPPPRLVRRVVALVVGLALGSGALAAQAAPRTPEAGWAAVAPVTPGWAAVPGPAGALPEPGWAVTPIVSATTPDRPGSVLPGGTRHSAPLPVGEVVVHRGDTLWSLARDHLGRSADDVTLARTVERLHQVNVDVIGADPDLLLPGQVLRLP